MTIPPHKNIPGRGASHHYSFGNRGEVCFHSDVERPDIKALRFGEWFVQVIESTKRQGRDSTDGSLLIMRILPELLGTVWSSRTFRAMIRDYLVDLDLLARQSTRSVEGLVLDGLRDSERYLLSEHVLKEELSIVQYVVRTREI
jgi:hypothetical protein